MPWLLILLLCLIPMKYGKTEIGGKVSGAYSLDIQGNDREKGTSLIGLAQTMLGNLKRRMQMGNLVSAVERKNFSQVEGDAKQYIEVSSIMSQGMMADVDKILIVANKTVAKRGKPRIIGFSIHFSKSTDAINYIVGEPYTGEIDYENGVVMRTDDGEYTHTELASNEQITSMSNTIYDDTEGPIIMERVSPGVPPTEDMRDFVARHLDHSVSTALDGVQLTPGGMAMIPTGTYNHLETIGEYTWQDGYLGKVEFKLGKEIEAEPEIIQEYIDRFTPVNEEWNVRYVYNGTWNNSSPRDTSFHYDDFANIVLDAFDPEFPDYPDSYFGFYDSRMAGMAFGGGQSWVNTITVQLVYWYYTYNTNYPEIDYTAPVTEIFTAFTDKMYEYYNPTHSGASIVVDQIDNKWWRYGELTVGDSFTSYKNSTFKSGWYGVVSEPRGWDTELDVSKIMPIKIVFEFFRDDGITVKSVFEYEEAYDTEEKVFFMFDCELGELRKYTEPPESNPMTSNIAGLESWIIKWDINDSSAPAITPINVINLLQ